MTRPKRRKSTTMQPPASGDGTWQLLEDTSKGSCSLSNPNPRRNLPHERNIPTISKQRGSRLSHGAKAYKLLLKDLERIRTKLRRHIEKEAADREAEFEAAMQYHSESDIQEAYGWEFISEQQYEHYLELFRQGRRHLMNTAPLLQNWLSPS